MFFQNVYFYFNAFLFSSQSPFSVNLTNPYLDSYGKVKTLELKRSSYNDQGWKELALHNKSLLLGSKSPQNSILVSVCTSSSLLALVSSKLPLKFSRFTSDPVVTSTLKIWAQFRKQHGLRDTLLTYTPLCNNHNFLPADLDHTFVT